MSVLFGPDAFAYATGSLDTRTPDNYDTVSGESAWQVVSGGVIGPSAGNADNFNYVNSSAVASFPNDQWCQCEIPTLGGSAEGSSGEGWGFGLRGSTSARTYARALFGTGHATYAHFNAGSYSGVVGGTSSAYTAVAGDVLYAEVQGTTYVIKLNGTQIHSVSNSTITSGRPGVCHSSDTNGAVRLDNFQTGDFTAASKGHTIRRRVYRWHRQRNLWANSHMSLLRLAVQQRPLISLSVLLLAASRSPFADSLWARNQRLLRLKKKSWIFDLPVSLEALLQVVQVADQVQLSTLMEPIQRSGLLSRLAIPPSPHVRLAVPRTSSDSPHRCETRRSSTGSRPRSSASRPGVLI